MCQYANEKKNRISCKKKYYNNPHFDRFSISSEILIDFGLTLSRFKLPFLTIGKTRCAVHSEKHTI